LLLIKEEFVDTKGVIKINENYVKKEFVRSYGSGIYLCNQCLSPLMLWVRILIRATCTTLCDKVCQWLTTGQWFSRCPLVSSTNKTDGHDKTKILLKGALNTIKTNKQKHNLLHFVLELLIYIW